MRLIVIPFYKYREGAPLEERMALYAKWKRDMARANPGYYHQDGEPRGFWGSLLYLFGPRR